MPSARDRDPATLGAARHAHAAPFAHSMPTASAAAVARLMEAGAIVLGKTPPAVAAQVTAVAPALAQAGATVTETTLPVSFADQRARLRFRDEVTPLIEKHDALLAPVAPSTAPAGLASTGDASLCAPWSWIGLPAIALPSGVDDGGLPHSVQLVQAAGADGHLLGVAAWCERVLAFDGAPPGRP